MTIRDIRLFGDPVLITKADEVTEFDSSLANLVDDMMETMAHHNGVGLAANQVGVTRRVFVFDCSDDAGKPLSGHVVNPVWEPLSEATVTDAEGCLSIPGVRKDTERFAHVRVTGQDVTGKSIEIVADGLLARCIQHETDHLDGVLFLKRLEPELRKEAMGEIRKSDWFQR